MRKHIQDDFGGGVNLVHDTSQIENNQYVFGINLRNRNELKPINKAYKLTTPKGKKQGIYAIGELLILFVAGKAYYKLPNDNIWYEIRNLRLDSKVDIIYGLPVPISSNNYLRKLDTTENINEKLIYKAVSFSSTPACLICQDGINQPWLIFADGSCRQALRYEEWTIDNREYVPIGKQMAMLKGKVYIVSTDGKNVYQSVSGRSLDFGVNIDKDGVIAGDATTTSFAVDFNVITCICALNTDSLYISTKYVSYTVTPDYTNTLFGEPQFPQTPLFAIGCVNQFSFIENVGDYNFISFDGIKSFNAVSQYRLRGNNAPFSLYLSDIFAKITQPDSVAAIMFDNYGIFSVKTHYGSIYCVYDSMMKSWTSLDIGVNTKTKMFAVTNNEEEQKLYALTSKDLYQVYGSTEHEMAILHTKTWTSTDNMSYGDEKLIDTQKSNRLKLVFANDQADDAGIVYVQEIGDGYITDNEQKRTLESIDIGIKYPMVQPILNQQRSVKILTVTFNSKEVYKIGYIISWTNGASLLKYEADVNLIESINI